MDFKHSELVDTSTYNTEGLCDGIPLRRHKDPMGEIKGAIRAQRDWSRLVCPARNYKGTLGNPFSFVRTTIPETLPERLEICSYANEYAFLYDDTVMEDLDQNLDSQQRQQILEEFQRDEITHAKTQKSADLRLEGAKKIQSQILKEMMAIDGQRAMTTMKSWQKYVQVVSSRQRSEPFAHLEEFLPYRISDAGELFWFGLVTFGMGLTIPKHEMGLCKSLSFPSWSALALTNDLYSWEKEREEAARKGEPHVMNAIWILMREHSISESRAKELCRQKIKECVAVAVRIVEDAKKNPDYSLDLKRYLEAILYSISGNLVWSIYCPRYHPEKTYDALTISMMADTEGESVYHVESVQKPQVVAA